MKVNVDALTPEVRATIPEHCDDVKVLVEAVGDLHAYSTKG
ncbi:hypothetical protein [Corallococcus sp. AB049A]|nr:hypothetical protein [Corallococcus sp. AB049A]